MTPVTAGAPYPRDEAGFAELVRRHDRELHVHCYRMLGSVHAAEDALQETLLKAWRARETFDGRGSVRNWLYRIATNVCMDLIRDNRRRAAPGGSGEVRTPYPDHLLDDVAETAETPDAVAVARETIELAFLTAVQVLPPRQRAVLMLRDVLGWSAAETARALGVTVAAANSMLQRARSTMRGRLSRERYGWRPPASPTPQERTLVDRYIQAHERGDPEAVIALLHTEDPELLIRPQRYRYRGHDEIARALRSGMNRPGRWRHVPVRANGRPGTAAYVLRPGTTTYEAFAITVLAMAEGRLSRIDTFECPELFTAFRLPPTLPAP